MSTSINFKSNENTTLFNLENDSEQSIAIQVSIATREMDNKGLEKNNVVKNDFTFYPSQLIIPPNEKRSVKVTYLGKEKPTTELAYRLIAEQLPIDLEKNKKNKKTLKVLLRYVAALYVTTDDMKSDVIVKNLNIDNKNIALTLQNKGNKHQILADLNLAFNKTKFTAVELKGASGENILANSERIFSFPKNGKFLNIQQTDKVNISFDKD
jgi:fimbrial chaperone protein